MVQTSNAQDNIIREDMFESIKSSLKHEPKIYFSFDNKSAFITNRKSDFLGAKLGLEYNSVFRYGIGFSTLFNKKYSGIINGIKKSNERLSFNYFSLFAEYIFNKKKNYDFSLPVQLSMGYSWIGNNKVTKTGHFMMFYETQLNGMYYFFNFVGLGAGVGYRIMFIDNTNIDEKFTAPIYSLKVKLIFGKLFKVWVKITKKILNKRYVP